MTASHTKIDEIIKKEARNYKQSYKLKVSELWNIPDVNEAVHVYQLIQIDYK